jgi:hypothetical protein
MADARYKHVFVEAIIPEKKDGDKVQRRAEVKIVSWHEGKHVARTTTYAFLHTFNEKYIFVCSV